MINIYKNFNCIKIFYLLIFFNIIQFNNSSANVIEKIEIYGNERISKNTIILFSDISIDKNVNQKKINNILKSLYETNFFENVSVSINNNILIINVREYPIIENINYSGIKSKRVLNLIKENSLIKSRSSYNEIIIKEEKNRLQVLLKNLGYYSGKTEISVIEKKII